MELAFEAVMSRLSGEDRRSYAQTLVALGAGKPIWGSLTAFGECDAALRVRRVVDWKPRGWARKLFSGALAVALVLFFYCGS